MPLKTQPMEEPALNLTPMIDVLFQLIIFFMLGMQFGGLSHQIEIDVPEINQTPDSTAAQCHVISLDEDGSLGLDGETVTLAELADRLRAATADGQPVLVRGHRRGTLQYLADVLQICSSVGVTELGVEVRQQQVRR